MVVIDTPGFGDSSGKDQENLHQIAEMLEFEHFVNAFVLVLNGESVRFDDQIFNMLQVCNLKPSYPMDFFCCLQL